MSLGVHMALRKRGHVGVPFSPALLARLHRAVAATYAGLTAAGMHTSCTGDGGVLRPQMDCCWSLSDALDWMMGLEWTGGEYFLGMSPWGCMYMYRHRV